MNADQLARFDAVFDTRYLQILAEATEREPAGVVLGMSAIAVIGAELFVVHR